MLLVHAGGQTSEKTYLSAMHEDVLPLLSKSVGDRSANPRREVAQFCGTIIQHRIRHCCWFDAKEEAGGNRATRGVAGEGAFSGGRDIQHGPLVPPVNAVEVDTELLSVLVILMGDDDDTVRKTSMQVSVRGMTPPCGGGGDWPM